MTKNRAYALVMALVMTIGISSCAQDDTMDELMNNVELAKPTADNDENGSGSPPPPPPPGE